MRVLLTGGTGFIGTNLVSYLKTKHIFVDNLNRETLKNEEKLENFVKINQFKMKQNYDVLIHLAADLDNHSIKKLISANVTLTKRLLDLCVKNKINRFIFISSQMVYGKTNYLPIDEVHPKNPQSNYGKSKLMAEKLCKLYSKDFGIQISILRVSSVFGYDQNEKYIIPTMFKDVLCKKIILHKYTNGYQLMDLIHVDDVSIAILKSCKSKTTGIYNVSSGIGITAFDLAKIISKFVVGCKILIQNKKQQTNHFLYDVSKIQKEINFKAKIKLNLKILKPWFKTFKKLNKSTRSSKS